MSLIKLCNVNLMSLVDAALQCGRDKEPVYVYIAADCGCGKTWSTKSLKDEKGVLYFSASYSPNQYKMMIKEIASSASIFIHDDVGRINPRHTRDFINIFNDLTEGHIETRQFRKGFNTNFQFSVIFTSTLDWYYSWKEILEGTGFTDRVLTFCVGIDEITRKAYQTQLQRSAEVGNFGSDPSQRKPCLREKHTALDLSGCNLSPRNLRSLLRISQYLNESEMDELIKVVSVKGLKYSI